MERNLQKIVISLALVLAALVSCLLLADKAMAQETYQATIASIDDKVETVLKLTATSTVASAGISAIPGDTATPIAEKLADFTEYFLLILCVLYSEKYLLTVIGAGVFKILVPLACGLFIAGMFWNPGVLKRLGFKMALFGLAIFLAIPTSVRVSDMIYDTYRASINETIAEAEEFTEETAELSETTDAGIISTILNKLSETASSLSNRAAEIMNRFVESLAVMIVTSCVIPLVVLLFFLWLIRVVTGIQISLPAPGTRPFGKIRKEI